MVRDFKEAWQAKDIGALVQLLDPNAVATSDGGGLVTALPAPLHGGEPIARFLAGLFTGSPEPALLERAVNGKPGLVVQVDDTVQAVLALDVEDDRVTRIWAVRNPEKLRPWTAG